MSSESSNDNLDADAVQGPDVHGHASILLVESLIHGLIARDVITVADAVEIVDTAVEVKADIAGDLGDSATNLRKSVGLLNAISVSLRRDLPHG